MAISASLLTTLIFALIVTAQAKPSVVTNRNSFLIDGVPRILRGGTIQWFRLPPETWEDRVIKFKGLGFNTVDAYVGWRNHEPVEGQFDWKTHDIVRFLDICKRHDLWVYLRPGPYITNEMDGGGVPQWVFTKTTKRVRDPVNSDGLLNLRTNDKDYLDAVRSYFAQLLAQVKPYLYTNGGPIILFAIENEFTWSETFFEVDKLAILPDGQPERPGDQNIDTKGYMTNLRNILIENGVDVPIATGPGDGKVSGMGDAEGIIPMPSVYRNIPGTYTIPFTAVSLLNDMHDPKNHEGSYLDMPSGITETLRDPYVLRASIFAGLDAVFQFNVIGLHQEGYQNAILMNSGDVANFDQAVDFVKKFTSLSRAETAFLKPPVGFFGNVLDYYATVSPSGLLREKYHQVRRFNLFVNDFEDVIGAVGDAKRSVTRLKVGWFGRGKPGYVNMDTNVTVLDTRIGTPDPDISGERANYWLQIAPRSAFIALYNDGATGKGIQLSSKAVQAFGFEFPKYTGFSVPVEVATSGEEKQNHLRYSMILPFNVTLPQGGITILYSTSEIMTSRPWGKPDSGRSLLVLYGTRGTEGEISFTPTASGPQSVITITATSPTVSTHPNGTVAYIHDANPHQFTVTLRTTENDVTRAFVTDVVVVDTYLAGKCWFPGAMTNSGITASRKRGTTAMICGPDFVNEDDPIVAATNFEESGATMRSLVAGSADVFSFVPEGMTEAVEASLASNPVRMMVSRYEADESSTPRSDSQQFAQIAGTSVELPKVGVNIDAFSLSGQSESQNSLAHFSEDGWESIGDMPVPLNHKGFATGLNWYRAEVMLSDDDLQNLGIGSNVTTSRFQKPKEPTLFVPFACDIVGIYVNGKYVTTLNPLGTEIDNVSSDESYKFTIPRDFIHSDTSKPQIITLRAEVWGHGSFLWFRGKLGRIPVPLVKNTFIPIPFARGSLPTLGFDSLKGIQGAATFCGKPLKGWYLKHAETDNQKVLEGGVSDGWNKTTVPLTMAKGEVKWVRMELDPEMFPDPDIWTTALNLRLKGKNVMGTDAGSLTNHGWLVEPGQNLYAARGASDPSFITKFKDEIPIHTTTLLQYQKNQLMMRFIDCGTFEKAGEVESIEFIFSANEDRFPRADGSGDVLYNSLRRVEVKVA
ncbi:Beta-galactosidase-1-like protein 2 [Dinochytrium kinnereticum]|nr:Beta-galactosidase-1-like protein 2 [Dinochytrium kinnereticum]